MIDRIIVWKLHTLGLYGTRNIPLMVLFEGIKGYTGSDFDASIIRLMKETLIMIAIESGQYRIPKLPTAWALCPSYLARSRYRGTFL